MKRIIVLLLRGVIALAISVASLWGCLALWFRMPGPLSITAILIGLFAVLGAAAIYSLFKPKRLRFVYGYGLVFAIMLVWWNSIQPPATGNWSPDVARQVTGEIDGDILTLENVREFSWQGTDEFNEIWTTRSFDLSQLRSVDIFLSYWAGPSIAHFILSFGFADGQYLAWSVEVRREIGGEFSPLADFFKENTIVIIAAVEQDVVGVRSNIRGEDVQLFRLSPDLRVARELLEQYVRDANALARNPRWYNSVTTNCTTVVFRMMDAIGNGQQFDWRMIINGYLPDYAYERGALNNDVSLEELRELGRIGQRASEIGLTSEFSEIIRRGVPRPDKSGG